MLDQGILSIGYRPGLKGAESRTEEIKRAAQAFESLFLYQLLKEMQASVGGNLFGSGFSGDVYQSLFDMEIAKRLAERGTGLSEQLIRELTREDAETKTTAAAPVPAGKTSSVSKEPSRELPVDGRISSPFGMRKDPFTGKERFHKGVDIAAPLNSPVYPHAEGVVVFSGKLKGYGNVVIVRHPDGVVTKYAHNAENLVRSGDHVSPDNPIALVGSTGRATGPHLHYEMIVDGRAVDPLKAG
ncbi:MAG: peptidase M23 [Nitrospirae bacterium]|nr:MAG: peptidase M23 [Nitrospirota bacterium]